MSIISNLFGSNETKPSGTGVNQPTQEPVPSGIFANIGDETLQRHTIQGEAKRGRGRPPMQRDESGNILRNPGQTKDQIPQPKILPKDKAVANAVPPIDREMVEKAINSLCKTVDSIFTRKIYKTAMAVTKSEELSKDLAFDAGMKVPEMELISSLGAVVMEKHRILGEHAPEVLLGITITGYSVRMIMTVNKLNQLAESKKRSDAETRKQNQEK